MAYKYRFQHFMDIQTSAESLTMLQVQAGGEYAMQRCKHLWGAFKYCKLGSISVKFLPMSTLPVDPAHMSYDSEDPYDVNPVDLANPGLVRITNGEDIFTDVASLSDGVAKQMYINTMLDPRWSKFMLQRGFSRRAVPLYWTLGQLHQDNYPGSVRNLPALDTSGQFVDDTSSVQSFDASPNAQDNYGSNVNTAFWNRNDSDGRGLFQTGHKGRLGWMPTDAFEYMHNANGENFPVPMVKPLPSINVLTVILPKAEKTEFFYRVYITETVMFSGIKNTGLAFEADGVSREIRAFDNFMQVKAPFPKRPDAVDQPMNGVDGQPMFGYPRVKNDGDMDW